MWPADARAAVVHCGQLASEHSACPQNGRPAGAEVGHQLELISRAGSVAAHSSASSFGRAPSPHIAQSAFGDVCNCMIARSCVSPSAVPGVNAGASSSVISSFLACAAIAAIEARSRSRIRIIAGRWHRRSVCSSVLGGSATWATHSSHTRQRRWLASPARAFASSSRSGRPLRGRCRKKSCVRHSSIRSRIRQRACCALSRCQYACSDEWRDCSRPSFQCDQSTS